MLEISDCPFALKSYIRKILVSHFAKCVEIAIALVYIYIYYRTLIQETLIKSFVRIALSVFSVLVRYQHTNRRRLYVLSKLRKG